MPVTYALVKVLVTGTMLVTNGLSERECKREVGHRTPLLGIASQHCIALDPDVAFYGTQCSTVTSPNGAGDHVTCVLKAFLKK